MKSSEGLTPGQTEIEKVEKEIVPISPEIKIIEISDEQLEQDITSAESHIQQQIAEILPEADKRIESSAQSISVSTKTLDSARQEFGLDARLQEVQIEADHLAQEAQSEITSVTGEIQPETSEVKEQTPEELKEERRMVIIKEIEKEWEAKNGAMERPLSEREIEENKYRAERFGEKWDGRTTQMTDKASEFFFAFNGGLSVPKRSDRILAERFPEYVEKNANQEKKSAQPERTEGTTISFAIPKVQSGDEVVSKISEELKTTKESGVVFDETTLEERQKALAEKPILDSVVLREATAVLEDESTFSWVQTDKIVGRPFADHNPGGWSFEYGERKGRIVEIAKELSGAEQDEQKIEHIFHPGKPNERIKLSVLEGPSGPMYSVEDGTHRVAGAMTTELREIPCDVKKIKYPLERITTVEDDISDWQKKIDLGLIQGEVETLQNDEGKKFYKLVVKKEILPWIRTTSQNELVKISRMYERMYQNSLDNLDIPRDALVDPIANNYFMAGRWKEWEEKFAQKPRDKNRIVIY